MPSDPVRSQASRPAHPPRRGVFRVSLRDKLLASVCALVTAAVLITAAAVASHTTNTLAAAASDAAGSDLWVQANDAIRRAVGAAALTALAIMLPVVYVLIARAFEPITRLHAAAAAVADGQFALVDIKRPNDAMGKLATAFNVMVERLREQKRVADDANAQLIQANLNLEKAVEERTRDAEATSDRLRQEIDERGDFFRAVSHDLAAPLRNIDGMVASVLRKHADQLPEDAIRRLERVRHNVAVESELIGEVLELSRIKSRQGEKEPVNVAELVWDLRGVFDEDLRQKAIEVIVETQLPNLVAEKARVRQVFQNLIDNAIKYMGDGPLREIRVGCYVRRDKAEFYVKDTGIGIAPDEAEKVFYAFRRGTNHGGVAGKGVGLAGVKAIVETLDGVIKCEPNPAPERGTCFRFTVHASFLLGGGAGVFRQAVAATRQPPKKASGPRADGTVAADDDALYGGSLVNESQKPVAFAA